MERREADVERDPEPTGVIEERTVIDGPLAPSQSEVVTTYTPGWRAVQLIYLVFGVIEGLLLIRLILKLLGANPAAGFSNWTYNVTAVFLAPFKNILPTLGTAQSQLEMSVVIAMLAYGLLGWAIGRFVATVFYRNVTVARRAGGLRPKGF
jgi:YggT family protein